MYIYIYETNVYIMSTSFEKIENKNDRNALIETLKRQHMSAYLSIPHNI